MELTLRPPTPLSPPTSPPPLLWGDVGAQVPNPQDTQPQVSELEQEHLHLSAPPSSFKCLREVLLPPGLRNWILAYVWVWTGSCFFLLWHCMRLSNLVLISLSSLLTGTPAIHPPTLLAEAFVAVLAGRAAGRVFSAAPSAMFPHRSQHWKSFLSAAIYSYSFNLLSWAFQTLPCSFHFKYQVTHIEASVSLLVLKRSISQLSRKFTSVYQRVSSPSENLRQYLSTLFAQWVEPLTRNLGTLVQFRFLVVHLGGLKVLMGAQQGIPCPLLRKWKWWEAR